MKQRIEQKNTPVKLKDWRQDSPTLWRWKVMLPTSITTSLGNPVVQNLKTTDAQIRSEITGQQITKQVKGDRKQLLHLPCLAFGAGRRRLLLLLPSLPTSHLPRGLPPPLHRAILSRAATGRHFSGGRAACASWESGKGRSSLASRNNGVLPITVGGSKGFPSGEDEDKMAFLVF